MVTLNVRGLDADVKGKLEIWAKGHGVTYGEFLGRLVEFYEDFLGSSVDEGVREYLDRFGLGPVAD